MPLGGAMKIAGATAAIDTFEGMADGWGSTGTKWVVGVGVDYGAYVEFGTSRSAPYPYLLPAARHVMRAEFPQVAAEAGRKSDPVGYIVAELAQRIEAKAKRNATGRPGPRVITGDLRASIEAVKVG